VSALDGFREKLGDEQIAKMIEIADVVGGELGESPEAWRGAAQMCELIAAVGVATHGDAMKALTTLAGVVAALRQQPAMVALMGPTRDKEQR